MKIDIGYGKGVQSVEIADKNLQGVLVPNEVEIARRGAEAAEYALQNPIDSPRLRDIVKPGEKIALITSDVTRPMPTATVMPAILEELRAAGVDMKDVSLVFGLGNHRQHTVEEKKKLVGEEAFGLIDCIDSDEEGFVPMGKTPRGTPVDVSKRVAEADRRIALGNIEYHYFAGYSGGVKAIMPGVSTKEAIKSNHSMMTNPKASVGIIEGNPVREDIEQAGLMCPVDFILNVVLDEHKKIVYAVAGHPVNAHREGCRFLDTLYRVGIDAPADIVIVSQAGAPKDLNLYQTQKALDNAKFAVRDGGIIVLVGECGEGLGEETFERWMEEAKSPRSLIERVEADFELGGHKAAAIAMVIERADIYLVSSMSEETVKGMFMHPYTSAQTALSDALAKLGEDAKVLVIPYGGSTLPSVK